MTSHSRSRAQKLEDNGIAQFGSLEAYQKARRERQLKARQTAIDNAGGEEAYKQKMRERGAKASREAPRGFATMDKERAREISREAANKRWHGKD